MSYENSAILYHPDKANAGFRFSGLTEEVDLVPTLLEMLGIAIPPTMVGKSYVKDLENENDSGKETVLCEAGGGCPTYKTPIENYRINAPHSPTSFGVGSMIRKGDFKLSVYGDDICEMYNLKDDPHELKNLYEDGTYVDIKNDLTTLLLKRIMSVKVRDIGKLDWDYAEYPYDVRFEPLENIGNPLFDVRASGDYLMEDS